VEGAGSQLEFLINGRMIRPDNHSGPADTSPPKILATKARTSEEVGVQGDIQHRDSVRALKNRKGTCGVQTNGESNFHAVQARQRKGDSQRVLQGRLRREYCKLCRRARRDIFQTNVREKPSSPSNHRERSKRKARVKHRGLGCVSKKTSSNEAQYKAETCPKPREGRPLKAFWGTTQGEEKGGKKDIRTEAVRRGVWSF